MLKAHHVGGQAIKLLLRLVDSREARHHTDKCFVGFFETFIEAFVHLAADFGQPCIGGFGEAVDGRRDLAGNEAHGGFNRMLLRETLFTQLCKRATEHGCLECVLALLQFKIQMRELLDQLFAIARQISGLIQLQRRQRLPQPLCGIVLAAG